jgi:ribosomal protein S18 acetylase RimI-like enzyme
MSNVIIIRLLAAEDLAGELLRDFDRRQETRRVWRTKGGRYWLAEDHFVDDWDEDQKQRVVGALRRCLECGGAVAGAFDGGLLVGLAGLQNEPFGRESRYLELDYLHVSRAYRRRGIGQRLFALCAGQARARGAQKLYLGAHPSEETQCFYRALGCVPAVEIDAAIYGREPRDIQLEFVL